MHDQMASGRRFRVLNIVDDVTRECLRTVPDTSIARRRVVRELAELIAERGKPGMIVSDNGTELTSNAVLAWCGKMGVEWHYIAPGKPMKIGFCERLASPPFGSMVACATNCSPRPCSSALLMPVSRSQLGSKIITGRDLTRPLATQPRRRSPPN